MTEVKVYELNVLDDVLDDVWVDFSERRYNMD
jgi:hypothetical protein